jgi:hypothetical protein
VKTFSNNNINDDNDTNNIASQLPQLFSLLFASIVHVLSVVTIDYRCEDDCFPVFFLTLQLSFCLHIFSPWVVLEFFEIVEFFSFVCCPGTRRVT